MLKKKLRIIYICFFALIFFLPTAALTSASAYTSRPALKPQSAIDFPTVNPDYIYDQLFTMVTHFQQREAGYDPVGGSGHTRFADYWAQEMVRDLQGFGPQIKRDPFPITGWKGRPATSPAFNVEVSVPGAVHSEQVVVIGCHYDGMAFSSQSANDDASGCAIELGVAKAMGDYWRSHQAYPARTLRFVIFDAEEQGLYGSYHYVNDTVNGDLSNIVAMFNEEQSGIAYPLRYLGSTQNPFLPFFIYMSPLNPDPAYALTTQQRHNIAHFRILLQQSILPVFQQFQAEGYTHLTYHEAGQQDIPEPIFTTDHMSNIHLADDTLGSSDQVPFTQVGLPCVTFVGNSSYYSQNPPPWSYPFDQPQDTIQLMNTFADGSSQQSHALTLALALPGMITTWMLNRPDILGQTTMHNLPAGPLAVIGDIGPTQAGQSLTLNANGSFDIRNASLTYTWDFGDGSKGSGSQVQHIYSTAGTYTLTLLASSATGTSKVSKVLNVTTHVISIINDYVNDLGDGKPPHNPQVTLPIANDRLSDKVVNSQTADVPLTQNNSLWIILIIGTVVLIGVGAIAGIRISRSSPK